MSTSPDEDRIEAAIFTELPRWERDVSAGYVCGQRRGNELTVWWFDKGMNLEPDRHVASFNAVLRTFQLVGLGWSFPFKGRNWQERLAKELVRAVLEQVRKPMPPP